MVAALSRIAYLDLAAGIPGNVLLLPQGVLPCIFPGSARLRSRRASHAKVSRRNCISFHSSEPSPLFSLRSDYFSLLSLARCVPRIFLRGALRSGSRYSGSTRERDPADDLCAVLPLPPPSGGRQARLLFLRVVRRPATHGLALVERSQQPAHDICLD